MEAAQEASLEAKDGSAPLVSNLDSSDDAPAWPSSKKKKQQLSWDLAPTPLPAEPEAGEAAEDMDRWGSIIEEKAKFIEEAEPASKPEEGLEESDTWNSFKKKSKSKSKKKPKSSGFSFGGE